MYPLPPPQLEESGHVQAIEALLPLLITSRMIFSRNKTVHQSFPDLTYKYCPKLFMTLAAEHCLPSRIVQPTSVPDWFPYS